MRTKSKTDTIIILCPKTAHAQEMHITRSRQNSKEKRDCANSSLVKSDK